MVPAKRLEALRRQPGAGKAQDQHRARFLARSAVAPPVPRPPLAFKRSSPEPARRETPSARSSGSSLCGEQRLDELDDGRSERLVGTAARPLDGRRLGALDDSLLTDRSGARSARDAGSEASDVSFGSLAAGLREADDLLGDLLQATGLDAEDAQSTAACTADLSARSALTTPSCELASRSPEPDAASGVMRAARELEAAQGVQVKPSAVLSQHFVDLALDARGEAYDGAHLSFWVKVYPDYPERGPSVRLMTKVFHPNVSVDGDIGQVPDIPAAIAAMHDLARARPEPARNPDAAMLLGTDAFAQVVGSTLRGGVYRGVRYANALLRPASATAKPLSSKSKKLLAQMETDLASAADFCERALEGNRRAIAQLEG